MSPPCSYRGETVKILLRVVTYNLFILLQRLHTRYQASRIDVSGKKTSLLRCVGHFYVVICHIRSCRGVTSGLPKYYEREP